MKRKHNSNAIVAADFTRLRVQYPCHFHVSHMHNSQSKKNNLCSSGFNHVLLIWTTYPSMSCFQERSLLYNYDQILIFCECEYIVLILLRELEYLKQWLGISGSKMLRTSTMLAYNRNCFNYFLFSLV